MECPSSARARRWKTPCAPVALALLGPPWVGPPVGFFVDVGAVGAVGFATTGTS